MGRPDEQAFREFMERVEPRLQRALIANFGWEQGREATAEALAYAWEHWDRIQQVDSPTGYLFRVGQSRVRHRKQPVVYVRPESPEYWVEPTLARLLAELPERQRFAVVLVHGFGWTVAEVAEISGVHATTIRTHLDRALVRLRAALEVIDHE